METERFLGVAELPVWLNCGFEIQKETLEEEKKKMTFLSETLASTCTYTIQVHIHTHKYMNTYTQMIPI